MWLTPSSPRPVNNAIYSQLGERWYGAEDDPVALLRAEAKLRAHWIECELRVAFPDPCRVLDVGCGAGFVTNRLAQSGHSVMGLDAAAPSLAVGRRHDATGRVQWRLGRAETLPFREGSFDAVCALDVLEHVEAPEWSGSCATRRATCTCCALFIKPAELSQMCRDAGLEPVRVAGIRPRLGRALVRLLWTGVVPPHFTFTRATWLGYAGVARTERTQ